MNKCLVYAQSGGPTAVINSSACGVIKQAQALGIRVLASLHGIDGILNNEIIDIDKEDPHQIDLIKYTPGSIFGSCRKKLPKYSEDDTLYKKILKVFNKLNVGYFIYNGGNDSMISCARISEYFKHINYDCKVIGVCKTIDNDLLCTDHCPGYGSAAKYIATACREIAYDTAVYSHGRITIAEIMGRDAGWLTAASAYASVNGEGPDLVYLPERPFDVDAFVESAKKIYEQKGTCLVTVSEGIRDAKGTYIHSLASNDNFGNSQLGGTASFLSELITQRTGIRTRYIEISLLQRCASHCSSLTDVEEAYSCGKVAVQKAFEGESNIMIAIKRKDSEKYEVDYVGVPLENVAVGTQPVPDKFINKDGTISDKFFAYLAPLVEGETPVLYEHGLPVFAKLKKIRIK